MQNLTSKLLPNTIKTALDEVFFQTFDGESSPGWINATNSDVFNQETMDSGAEIMEVFRSTGLWDERMEEQNVKSSVPGMGNPITFIPTNYADSINISKNYFDDHKFSIVSRMMTGFANMARKTREINAFSVFNNAFTTTVTGDGSALIADSRTRLDGGTVDNKLTAALSETALNDAIIALANQVDHNGVIMGNVPRTLLVPIQLFKLASEILGAELHSTNASSDSSSTFNDYNVFSSKYGINLVTSPFLTDPNAWFLLASNHGVMRFVRQDVVTDMIPYQYQTNNVYVYKGEYRETLGAVDYAGIVGSDGSA